LDVVIVAVYGVAATVLLAVVERLVVLVFTTAIIARGDRFLSLCRS
jgi:hypothetical protein